MSRELSVGMADCFGKSDLPFLRCEGYFTELTAMVQLQIDKDHSFDAYFPAESSASSLQDVTKLEFTQIHWTDDRLQRMSNLPDRVPALVELVLHGMNRKRKRRDFNMEEILLSSSQGGFGKIRSMPARGWQFLKQLVGFQTKLWVTCCPKVCEGEPVTTQASRIKFSQCCHS